MKKLLLQNKVLAVVIHTVALITTLIFAVVLYVDGINPLRKGALLESDLQKITTYPLKVKRMVEKYGYRSVGKEYFPHLSLTRLANQLSLPQMTTTLQWQDMAFTVNKVGIYIGGENGTCRRLIKMYHLNG